MYNQTYSIRDSSIEMLKCDLSSSGNYLVASPVTLDDQRDQIKQRLSDMRKRTRILLARHDWQKFLAAEEDIDNSLLTFDNDDYEDEYELSYATANNSVSPHNSLIFEQVNSHRPTAQNDSKLNLFSLNSVSTIPLLEYDSILFEDKQTVKNVKSMPASRYSYASISKGMLK
jgi:hypothetical protein